VHSLFRVKRPIVLLLVAFLLACSEEGGSGTAAFVLQKVSGDSQGVAVQAASAALVVRVLDPDSVPVEGAVVTFAVTLGNGAVVGSDTTDLNGDASTIYTATTTAGARKIRARLGDRDVIFDLVVAPGAPAELTLVSGNDQAANANSALGSLYAVRVLDGFGNGVPDAVVRWTVTSGGGSVSADSTLSNALGQAQTGRTLGAGAGAQWAAAVADGTTDTVFFHATARKAMTTISGGNNVADRCTSDLWVHGNYAYTGTWGFCGASGNKLYVWNVAGASPAVVDSITFANVGTVSDNEVTADGSLLLVTGESGSSGNGLYIYSLTDPAHPVLVGFEPVGTGLHTGTFAEIGGELYVFASKNPGTPALMGFRIQPDSTDKIVVVSSVTQPSNYGIHDQFYRDGFVFASVWNTGLRIYDVAGVMSAGSPGAPELITQIATAASGVGCSCVHNAWWYHDTDGGKRYVFVGQEGPGSVGSSSSGLIHVVDISNLGAPAEVASYAMGNVGGQSTGVHNFWMDETRGILYAAYYNGGVVALDVTGTLSGNLATREIARITPGGGGNTYVWGVMLANGWLWASDMVSGFWKLGVP
jgi:hypothetical protein